MSRPNNHFIYFFSNFITAKVLP